jgi:hypothetical protein
MSKKHHNNLYSHNSFCTRKGISSANLKRSWIVNNRRKWTVFASIKKKNSVALSPRANYTDWATATCRRNLVSTFVDRGVLVILNNILNILNNIKTMHRSISNLSICRAPQCSVPKYFPLHNYVNLAYKINENKTLRIVVFMDFVQRPEF